MLVTAILPTRGRPDFAPKALTCILAQAWQPLEIIILDDKDTPSFPIPEFPANVLYERVRHNSLGLKLNLACDLGKGEYIVRFDDDDWYAPGRIADQVTRLVESGKGVTNYRNVTFSDGTRTWMNRNWPGGYGASLAFRRDWWQGHPFPHISLGEDWEFVSEAMRADRFIVGDAQDLMLASIHPGNISLRVIGQGWEEIGVRQI